MSDQLVRDAIHAIEVRPDTVGLTHAKILRNEVRRLEVSAGRQRMVADAATLALIPERFRVPPTCEESSAYAIAVAASLAAMRDASAPVPHPVDEWHEDDGDVVWWRLPVTEPPYVGRPGDDEWIPGYFTHWTPVTLPRDV